MAGPVGPVNPRFWGNLARRSLSGADDAAAHLARLNVAARAQRPANMELGSPLFNRMYRADQAYEQLARGQTANLRHAGGDFARIAGQAIRDENAAAAAARAGSPLERALQIGPDGQLVAAMLAGGMTAAGGGMAINNALEERRRRQEEDSASNATAVEALMERRRSDAAIADEQMEALDSLDPVSTQVYADPEYDRDLADSLAVYSAPQPFVPRSNNHMLREQRDDILLPDGDTTLDLDEMAYDALMMHEGFDPAGMPIVGGEDAPLVFSEDIDTSEEDAALLASMASESAAMARDRGGPPIGGPFNWREPVDRNAAMDFHTGRIKSVEEQILPLGGSFGAPLPPPMPGAAPPPPKRRTAQPFRQQSKGVWYTP